MRFPASPIEKRGAGAAASMCHAGLLVVGVVSAAQAPSGRIVFASSLPAYPLPNNFQQARLFSIGLNGKGRSGLTPSPTWIWSRGDAQIYYTVDTAAGAEIW